MKKLIIRALLACACVLYVSNSLATEQATTLTAEQSSQIAQELIKLVQNINSPAINPQDPIFTDFWNAINKIAPNAEKDFVKNNAAELFRIINKEQVANPGPAEVLVTPAEYAKKTGKDYLLSALNFYILNQIPYGATIIGQDPSPAVKSFIKSPNFDPNGSLTTKGTDLEFTTPSLNKIIEWTSPNFLSPEILDLVLEKGALLNINTTRLAFDEAQDMPITLQVPTWQLPFEKAKEKLAEIQTDARRDSLRSDAEKEELKESIEFNKKELKKQLTTQKAIMSIIKKHAQKRGDQKILEEIAKYEAELKELEKQEEKKS